MDQSNTIYVYPTDTVWGIGCSIYNQDGFEKIAKIKKTKADKPLSILFESRAEIELFFNLEFIKDINLFFKIFDLETSIMLPSYLLKVDFPQYLLKLSPYISLRLISNSSIKKIRNDIGCPFFSTSLNITGENPITDLNSALLFHKEYAADTQLVCLDQNQSLSGISSTLIKIEDNQAKIMRPGSQINIIRHYLAELNLL